MNKLNIYNAMQIQEASKRVNSILEDYPQSSPVRKKLNTVARKLEYILETELTPELQEEYNLLGVIRR